MKIANDYSTLSVSHSAVTNAVAYDAFNVMTNMTTYRNAGGPGSVPASGDTTTWSYDEATGLLLAKTYADGHGPTYTYTDSGNLATRTWARGIVTTYAYDGWNQLVSTVYSDGTPSISLAYDAMGRQISATDAVGTTVTTYNDYGEVASESVSGLYSRTVSHVRDAFGRDLGYNIGNSRMSIVEYEADTARMKRVKMAGAWFTYYYLPGTDLKSRLQYGGSGSAYYTYEPSRDLLTQVQNYINGGVISQYDYVNDAAGRRIAITRSGSMMSETRTDHYGYNDRSELTNAVKNATLNEYAYQYDDIGNRLSSLDLGTNRTYTANALNQYTLVGRDDPIAPHEEFSPQYDLDGNQTLIQTSTGIWSVTYNGENRPVLRTCGATNIVMSFDRMGRRVEYIETVSDNAGGPGSVPAATNAHHRFVYDGYVCIQRLNAASNNAIDLVFGWDPSEPVATRPLVLQKYGQYNLFYTHDGNKNVSELVFFQQANGIAAHYEYAPFGAVTYKSSSTPVVTYDFEVLNPYRNSSECNDDSTGLTYYNFRHYTPFLARWNARDLINELDSQNLYQYCRNGIDSFDELGATITWYTLKTQILSDFTSEQAEQMAAEIRKHNKNYVGIPVAHTTLDVIGKSVKCKCIYESNGDKDEIRWVYSGAAVTLRVTIHMMKEYGSSPPRSWAEAREREHEKDALDWIDKQRTESRWNTFEVNQQKKSYESDAECESIALQDFDFELTLALLEQAKASKEKWDNSGKHTWPPKQ